LQEGLAQARRVLQAGETRFTRFSETSELAQLNRSAGKWFIASPELYELLLEARGYVEQTGGLFDPSILEALERAGYDKSMDEIRTSGVSAPPATRQAPARPQFLDIEFDEPGLGRASPVRHAARPGRHCQGLAGRTRGATTGRILERVRRECGRRFIRGGIAAGSDGLAGRTRRPA